jgi:hypothetical protein
LVTLLVFARNEIPRFLGTSSAISADGIEIAAPRQVGARNDTEDYCPTLQT